MNRTIFISRIRVLSYVLSIIAFTYLLRQLMLVLRISYEITGFLPVTFSAVLLVLSLNFLYFSFTYLARIGPEVGAGILGMWREWMLLSPLNRLVTFSGLLSLPLSLIMISGWVADWVQHTLIK